jgi:hypothetical protein
MDRRVVKISKPNNISIALIVIMVEAEWRYNANLHGNVSVKLHNLLIQEFIGGYRPVQWQKKHSIVGKHLERVIVVHNKEGRR